MAQASSFIFDSYELADDSRTLQFKYAVTFEDESSINLAEQLILPVDISLEDNVITKLLENLHIGLGISYYKIFLPSRFELKKELSDHQASFWNEVYLNGLAEFLYTNKLSPDRLAKFSGRAHDRPDATLKYKPDAILALGGGKDSVVAGELLKKSGLTLDAFVLATGDHTGQTANVAKDMGLNLLNVDRKIDLQILELNKRSDSYNGHIPISMAFALVGLLLCVVTGKRYLAVGNEDSASIPNTTWQGLIVNHQWSKSLKFEKLIQAFIHQTISPELWYFSAIRPLSSVAVAKLFAKYSVYLNDFTSCNRVFLIDPAKRPNSRWCGECAKCLSSFIILAPWLKEPKLIEIFGKNMLNDTGQTSQFLALTGLESHKPLDCVGTEEEMILSLNLVAKQKKFADAKLIKLARERGIMRNDDWDSELRQSLVPSHEHGFPPELTNKLISVLEEGLA